MTDQYVYLLSSYGEYGAENVHATLDRTAVIAVLKKHWPEHRHEHAGLIQLLTKTDDELIDEFGHDLVDGWGGIQLHVVKLEP